MTTRDDLLQLERAGWEALCAGGEAATRFYTDTLAREIVMLLPGGMVIDDRDQAIDSMGGSPWTSFELFDGRVLELGEDAAIVFYRATAHRPDMSYTALFNSTYVREGGAWRLAVHQQTPAGDGP